MIRIRNFAKHFRKWMKREHNIPREGVDAIYFSEYGGCLPDGYLGDDVMIEIINKFYRPLDFLCDLFNKQRPDVDCNIVVMPSYEDATFFVIYRTNEPRRILYDSAFKAWHFVWSHDEKGFNEWCAATLKTMMENA